MFSVFGDVRIENEKNKINKYIYERSGLQQYKNLVKFRIGANFSKLGMVASANFTLLLIEARVSLQAVLFIVNHFWELNNW